MCGEPGCKSWKGCHWLVLSEDETKIMGYPVRTRQEAEAVREFHDGNYKLVHNWNTSPWK